MGSARTSLPLICGFLVGMTLTLILVTSRQVENFDTPCAEAYISAPMREYKDVSGDWVVHQDPMPAPPPNQDATPKVIRTRFAATELGTREKLMVAVLAESSLAVTTNTTLGRHFPNLQMFADSSRIDGDLATLTNLISYKLNGQKPHALILSSLFNLTVHESYDWMLLMTDSAYINPFAIWRYVNSVNWNNPVLIGLPASDGSGRCRLDTGILISNPALQTLIHQRHICNTLASGSTDSDQLTFEKCLQVATNLTCQTEYQNYPYSVWGEASGKAAHDYIGQWSEIPGFNDSVAVPQLLSDADARSLHDHFVRVELARLDEEIDEMEELHVRMTDALHTEESPSWPPAVPGFSKPPNRYQVSTWEFFTMKDIFRSEPNQNVRPLEGKDRDDVMEVLNAARKYVETKAPELEFVQLRNGYRVFDPRRGMDYMIDLTYRNSDDEIVERRVHLNRFIASTQLLSQVPYVKEDTDLTIVVPVADETEVMPTRKLLARHARLCTAATEETRKTRIVVVVFSPVEAHSTKSIADDLEELKRRCKRSFLEADVLTIKRPSSQVRDPAAPPPPNQNEPPKTPDDILTPAAIASAALDETIDRYGPNTMFLLLPAYADVQKEFLDRVRINTIKHYQVFFPIPFVEFHPTIAGMDMDEKEAGQVNPVERRDAALAMLRDGAPAKRKRPLIVQKDHGRFDSLDFSCISVYGVDYLTARSKLSGRRIDLVSLFLAQSDIHIMRVIEPTLRFRYHPRNCDLDIDEDDASRCVASKRENVAAKDQLAKLIYNEQ
ncbi:hypothetical protein WR25_01417 [Diploscapter pachys]|uniref:Hexosyltransferase n=1 Tax=Diploscapter pachys TaxID=2018661 RepID=A0A2A2L6P9_9BILA|nr:hypothetical protein WR25_01417 [Diploscapter pachys]